MDKMMITMIIGDMNLGGEKTKSKAKGSNMDDMMGFMMGAGAGPGGPIDLGLTSDDSYYCDELNWLGRDMGLNKEELVQYKKGFKADLDRKRQASKKKEKQEAKAKEVVVEDDNDDDWEDKSD
jgi:hypothetical protein